jgi:tetratricopeptide (TPR) repeat protein
MTQRALAAQLAALDEETTMAESMRSTRVAEDECRTIWEEGCPPEERNSSRITRADEDLPRPPAPMAWTESLADVHVPQAPQAPQGLQGEDDEEDDTALTPILDVDRDGVDVEELTPIAAEPPRETMIRSAIRARKPVASSAAPVAAAAKGAKAATPDESGPRPVANRKMPFDALEARYRDEGNWRDLIALYRRQSTSAEPIAIRAEILRRLGAVMRDQQNDAARALDVLVEALELEPDHLATVAAVERLARAQGGPGKWGTIVQTIESRLDNVRRGENGETRELLLCEHLLRWTKAHLGKKDRAASLIDRIRAIDPTHPAVHRRMASLYREQGAWDAQREELDKALLSARTEAEQKQLHVAMGELAEQRFNDLATAMTHFDRALEIDPTSMEALGGVERICRVQERFIDLVLVLERQVEAAKTPDACVAALLRLAEVHERHFLRPQQAASRLEEALSIAPGSPEALVALERCYRAMRAWGPLVRTLEERAAIAKSKNEKIELMATAAEIVETTMGDPSRAALAYRRMYEVDDRNQRALTELARLCERAQDWTGAAAYRARLAELAPNAEAQARLYVSIGEMLAPADRDPKLSRVHFERAIRVHPACTAAWEALEREARKEDAIDRVAEYLERRVEHTESPRLKAQLLVQLGAVRFSLGEDATASEAYERAVAVDPMNETAAEAMLARYVGASRWAESQPLCELLVNAATRDGNVGRAFELLRMATRIASALGNGDRALTAALAAYEMRPVAAAKEDIVEVCHRARTDRDILVRAWLALDEIAGAASELSPSSLGKMGDIRRVQGAPDAALDLYSRALILDSEARLPLAGITEICIERGEWERAASFKQRLAELATGEEEKFGLLVDAGELLARRANKLTAAAEAYEAALLLRPSDHWLLHALMWVYGELGAWDKLVGLLRAVANLEAEPTKRAKSVLAMAQVMREKLGDAKKALSLYDETLDLDCKRLEAFEQIVRIYTELRDWNELKGAYGRMLRRLKNDGDVDLKHALFFQLGLIFRDRLVDAPRALDAFRAAARLKPESDDVRKVLCELFVVTSQIDAAVAMVRAAIKKRPQEPALYDELYSLFLRQGAFDKAWCALDAMTVAGGAFTPEQAQFYADYPPTPLASVPGTLTPAAWRTHVVHPELEPALTALFATLMPAVLRARLAVLPSKWLSKTLGAPLTPKGASANRVLSVVNDASEILGLPVPTLHACKGPVPLAPTMAHPAMHVSLEACDGLADPALAFMVGKRLAELRPELSARSVFPSVTELTALVQTAGQLARGEPFTSTKGASTKGPEAAFEIALRTTITEDERHTLRSVLNAARAQSAPLDVARWSQLADVSASRLGLLLAGRLEPAGRATMNETLAPGDLPPRDKLSELLVFAVSDEYADLRAAIGVGIGSE